MYQEDEDEGFDDKDSGELIPARVEGEEGTDAVVVGPVQEQVGEQGEENKGVEQGPEDGGGGQGTNARRSGGRERVPGANGHIADQHDT